MQPRVNTLIRNAQVQELYVKKNMKDVFDEFSSIQGKLYSFISLLNSFQKLNILFTLNYFMETERIIIYAQIQYLNIHYVCKSMNTAYV